MLTKRVDRGSVVRQDDGSSLSTTVDRPVSLVFFTHTTHPRVLDLVSLNLADPHSQRAPEPRGSSLAESALQAHSSLSPTFVSKSLGS